ncbi:uncharacterized protein LOC101853688 isoform X1 [Aplysia californica]|uniref:Uncharacterized protein LOC101853688 isoform X1 n=1 Tax=Aplysia californica TaxID=6500 RepID=A0ABM0ZX71_APLCA|nr:uncharacterized protein LOC101853688 isoform X1 [Aplysia californica]
MTPAGLVRGDVSSRLKDGDVIARNGIEDILVGAVPRNRRRLSQDNAQTNKENNRRSVLNNIHRVKPRNITEDDGQDDVRVDSTDFYLDKGMTESSQGFTMFSNGRFFGTTSGIDCMGRSGSNILQKSVMSDVLGHGVTSRRTRNSNTRNEHSRQLFYSNDKTNNRCVVQNRRFEQVTTFSVSPHLQMAVEVAKSLEIETHPFLYSGYRRSPSPGYNTPESPRSDTLNDDLKTELSNEYLLSPRRNLTIDNLSIQQTHSKVRPVSSNSNNRQVPQPTQTNVATSNSILRTRHLSDSEHDKKDRLNQSRHRGTGRKTRSIHAWMSASSSAIPEEPEGPFGENKTLNSPHTQLKEFDDEDEADSVFFSDNNIFHTDADKTLSPSGSSSPASDCLPNIDTHKDTNRPNHEAKNANTLTVTPFLKSIPPGPKMTTKINVSPASTNSLQRESALNSNTSSAFESKPIIEKPKTQKMPAKCGDMGIDTSKIDDFPEHLDSYSETLPLKHRRPSMWNKLRDLSPLSLLDRVMTPTERTITSSPGYTKAASSSKMSTASSDVRRSDSKHERCPNCGEMLQRAKPTLVAVKGNEKTFLSWILNKWGKRKELQSFGATSQHRGYLPHYCNFVKTKTLHDRSSSPALITTDDDDDVDDGYITNTEQTPSEKTTSGRRKPRPVITKNKDDATGGKEGGIIRAMSPGSTGYDPSTLFDRLREEGLAARQPIQIPTTADVTKDQDVTDTERTKTEDDLAAKVDRLTSEGVKDTKSMSRTPIAPPPSATKGKGRRTSCPKKEKVVKERKRKGKKKEQTEEGEKKEDAGQVTQVSEQREDGAETDKAVDITVDVKVPDLPTVGPAGKERTKGKRRKTTKQQISAPKAAAGKKTGIDTSDQKTASFYDFGDLTASTVREETMFKAPVIPSYLNDRMVLSLQSSRFELPMDMKSLEKMTPQEYLRKHCIITTRRRTLYQKIFQKHRDKDGSIHGKHVLCKALKEVLVNTISTDQVDDMCRMLEVNETTSVDIKLFSGVAALAERILYPDFLTEDTADRTEYHKEKVECADFCALEWKLHGLHVNGHVRKILETLG